MSTQFNEKSIKEHPAEKILQAIQLAEGTMQRENQALLMREIIEEIGILLLLLRNKNGESIQQFSSRLQISPDLLLAFELGILPREKICEILPTLIRKSGVSLRPIRKKLQLLVSKL